MKKNFLNNGMLDLLMLFTEYSPFSKLKIIPKQWIALIVSYTY